ncbi:MAG: hypothetical protein JW744_01790 [Candidatus Diapherotrites archaeon]|uniref:1-(5-phosphoribosyl)-5-((5-phosphoribosylamino)methylideneamino)imidazole-4-carboxamide isomerase n=1 Tax=Candidatus Iainarchaeum sp. TaxID=3101447 RepID=A0A938YW36_9ARCH|nr:hypothetical protein [Candidatus Diapherotrites archaeon]
MIIPSIDLMNGKIVQLRQGKEKMLELKGKPAEFAETLSALPAVQIIDLDAALGRGGNSEMVDEICKVVNARVGGGIRSMEKAMEILDAGAKKVIIGSRAKPEFLQSLAKEFGRGCLHCSS